MRLFVALDIDEAIRQKISRFMDGVREFAPDVRWVNAESLHVTLKFIGERSDVEEIKSELAKTPSVPVELSFQGYGFFPSPGSARVFWIGIRSSAVLSTLASAIDESLTTLGIPRETHTFSPHLTLARTGSGRPGHGRRDRNNPIFHRLQQKLSALPAPEFGTMTAREFFLYQSQLSPKGSRYSKLAGFGLR
jgi:2'-5' RNA ligase